MKPAAQTQDIIAAIASRARTLERNGCDEETDRAGKPLMCPTPTFCAEAGCSRLRRSMEK